MAGYGDDSGFNAWLTENDRTLPSGAPSVAALRERGSVYLDGLYFDRFPGVPTNGAAQERQWPRTGAEDRWGNALASDTVPDRVIKASYEAAWIEANSAGALAKTFTPGEQKVLTQVDKIRWEVVGDVKGDQAMVVRSTAIEGLLGPILVPTDIPDALVV